MLALPLAACNITIAPPAPTQVQDQAGAGDAVATSAAPVVAEPSGTKQKSVFTHSTFSFEHAQKITERPANPEIQSVLALLDGADGLSLAVAFTTSPSSFDSLRQYTDEIREAGKSEVIFSEQITIGGSDAYHRAYYLKFQSKPEVEGTAWVNRGGRQYIINYSYPKTAESEAKNAEEILTIFDTWAWK